MFLPVLGFLQADAVLPMQGKEAAAAAYWAALLKPRGAVELFHLEAAAGLEQVDSAPLRWPVSEQPFEAVTLAAAPAAGWSVSAEPPSIDQSQPNRDLPRPEQTDVQPWAEWSHSAEAS